MQHSHLLHKGISLCKWIVASSTAVMLVSCANIQTASSTDDGDGILDNKRFENSDYSTRLPATMNTAGRKTILVDPNVHAWGAYAADGHLVRAGIATAGGAVCPPDANESDCRTGIGTFHITSIGGADCYSKKYPKPYGGGLMPFCMHFHNGQALHGSPDNIVVEDNISHGCVRMRIPDAEWMVSNFAQVGTKVVVTPY